MSFGRFDDDATALWEFARCQRPDGSTYGTGGQCRLGREISLEPGEGTVDLYKKAMASGIKNEEWGTIIGQVRERFGIKRVSKGPALDALFEEVKKRLEEDVVSPSVSKGPSDKPAKEKPPEPKPKPKPDSKPAKPESAPSSSGGSPKASSRISDEKLKETFNRALDREAKLKAQAEELSKQNRDWRDPEVKALNARIGKAHEAALLMRQAYYAQDRDAFIKAVGERKKLTDEADKLSKRANQMLEKDGLNVYNVPSNHPAVALQDKVTELRLKADELRRDRVSAAYFGEPATLTKAKSDGGGTVSASVPSGLPKGGADKDLKDFLDGAEPVMAFNPKGFAKFVKDDEAKNGFEAGTAGIKKGNRGYLDGRREGERRVLNILPDADPKDRPVYAALEHPDRARSLQGGASMMAQYGGVQVVLKNEVKDRSTFTVGDSLDVASPRGIKASPVRDPANPSSQLTEVRDVNYNGGTHGLRMSLSTSMDNNIRLPVAYVETQIHGGLRTSDIKEVRIYKGHDISTSTRKSLEKQGVKIVELPPQMDDLRLERSDPNYRNIEAISPFYQ